MIRVLLVSGSYPPMKCGVGDYTARLAEALAQTGQVEVGVLTSEPAAASTVAGVQIIGRIPHWRASQAARATRMIRSWRPDVVHIQYPTQGYAGAPLANFMPLLARLSGAAIVQTWHEPMRTHDLLIRCLVPSEVIVVRPNLRALLPPAARWLLGSKALRYVRGASALPAARLSESHRRTLRGQYLRGQRRLIVFFGFVYAHKGVDLLFDVADPETDHLVIAGNSTADLPYQERLIALAKGKWLGKVTFTGFITTQCAAELLAISDAVVLPFRMGGGEWNSSIHAATANGAYVITTSTTRTDYDASENVAYTRVDDVEGMRTALSMSQVRQGISGSAKHAEWDVVASIHMQIYLRQCKNSASSEAV